MVVFTIPKLVHLSLWSILLSVVAAADDRPAKLVDVFVSGQDGYHTYRIPAVIVAPDGTVLAFCEGRQNHGFDSGDIDIVLKRSTDNGQTWGPPAVIAKFGTDTIGNPCPVVDRITGRIWLLATTNLAAEDGNSIRRGACEHARRPHVLFSDDNGLTWSQPVDISGQVRLPTWQWTATGPGVGIQLEHDPYAGRLVIPCDHTDGIGADRVTASHVIYSDDHGRSWHLGKPVIAEKGSHFTESQVVELSDGRLMINMRNPGNPGSRGLAYSFDGGKTWPEVYTESVLIEPGCQASTITIKDPETKKAVVLFSNPANAIRPWRVDLTVRASFDDGQTWPVSKLIHPGPAASYSCLVDLGGGQIGLLYEYGSSLKRLSTRQEKIVLAVFSYQWLISDNTQRNKEID